MLVPVVISGVFVCRIRSYVPKAEDGGLDLGQIALFPGIEASCTSNLDIAKMAQRKIRIRVLEYPARTFAIQGYP